MTNRLQRRLGGALVLSGVAALAGVVLSAAPGPASCSQLTTLKLPDIRITDATAIAAAATGVIRAAHCRVDGIIGTETRFRLLLPDDWNTKFFMGGGGGFVGSVQNEAVATVNQGYATVGTDTGHQGSGLDASWAHNSPERRANFGYLAIHRTADTAKAIVAHYYGSEATRSYFSGCSRGGGQALMEAQRYPQDFDGIIAGAPAYDWTGIGSQMIRNTQMLFPDPKNLTPMFTSDELRLLEARVVAACDAVDGVEDGVLNDPRECAFDLGSLPLPAAKTAALKAVYAPTVNVDGEIYPGQPFGGEGQTAGWPTWIIGGTTFLKGQAVPSLGFAFGTGIFKYLVFNDPDWDYTKYDLDRFKNDSAQAAAYLNATDPNLDAFKARGGKLVLWHGWADSGLTPLATIRYHEQVHARDANARAYLRTFMLPGVLHCNGGAGPDTVDWASVIADWVEHGRAPDRVVARKVVDGETVRTRPLCPYPLKAEYSGQGSTDDERNFVCK